jgi:hypothetical protein
MKARTVLLAVTFILLCMLMYFACESRVSAGTRTLTFADGYLSDTISVPDEVPNFVYNCIPKGYINFYSGRKVDAFDMTYDDPMRKWLTWHVVGFILKHEKRLCIVAICCIDDHGRLVKVYIDREMFAYGHPTGDLEATESPLKLQPLIDRLEKRERV